MSFISPSLFLQGTPEPARGVHALCDDGLQGPLLPAGLVHDLHQAEPPPPRRQLIRQHLHLLRHGGQIQVNTEMDIRLREFRRLASFGHCG